MSTKTRILKIHKKHPELTNREIAERIGCSINYVPKVLGADKSRGLKHAPGNTDTKKTERPGVNSDFSGNTGYVEFRTNKHIKDLPQALKEQGVDLDVWEVERVKTSDNAWDVTMNLKKTFPYTRTNYQFKIEVWLKRIQHNVVQLAMEELIKAIPALDVLPPPEFTAPSGVALEVAMMDAHFGKMAWAAETGRRDYDLEIATRDYMNAIDQTLAWGRPYKPEKIYYLLGQDLMHTENYEGTTFKAHNVLDTDSRLPKITFAAMLTTWKAILKCRKIAPVEVIWIPGNHDLHASMYLAVALKMAFINDPHVTVDVSPAQRKARLWGNLLVGWCHGIVGREPAWVNELAQAFPELWGQSVFREWHYGHKHKKTQTRINQVNTQGGVLLRQLTALSPIDAWHYEFLFTDAVPGGESLIWTKDRGVIANFTAWTDAPVLTQEELANESMKLESAFQFVKAIQKGS